MEGNNVSIEALDEQTWIISEGTGRGRTHCYLVEGDNFAVLIDTGRTPIDMKGIVEKFTSKSVYIINTHGHLDHISNNHQFSKVYMHPDDEQLLEEQRSYNMRSIFFMNRYLDKGYTHEQLQSPTIQKKLQVQATLPKQVMYTPVFDGMRLDLGGRILTIITTPGHTQGSICIMDEKYYRLYTGDTICEDGVLLHFPYSTSVPTFLQTLQKLKNLSSQFDTLYGGHQSVPLALDTLDAYITCATSIMQGDDDPIKHESAAGIGYRTTIQGATISYIPTKEKS